VKVHSLVPEALKWRYDNYIAPYVDLYGSLGSFFHHRIDLVRKIKKCKVAYIYANRRNVGDYISFLGIKQYVGEDGVELFCSPVWAGRLNYYLALIQRINPNCTLVIGGGGLFQPVFSDFWSSILRSNLKFIVSGVGINKMQGRELMDSALLNSIVDNSQWISVRDNMSVEILQDIGGTNNRLTMGICPAVAFVNSRHWVGYPKVKENNILLHVYHPSDLRLAGANFDKICVVLKEIAKANSMEYSQHSNMSADFSGVLTLFSKSRIVFSSRLHGCIISHSMGIPYVPLVCDDKMTSFLESHTTKSGYSPIDMENLETASKIYQTEIDKPVFDREKIQYSTHENELLYKDVKTLIENNSAK